MIDVKNYGQCIGFEQLTIDATSGGIAFTVTKYHGVDLTSATQNTNARLNANLALVTVEGTAGTNDIRWTQDGTAPTSSVGHLAEAGATSVRNTFTVRGRSNLIKFRAIRVGGTSGAISVSYFIN